MKFYTPLFALAACLLSPLLTWAQAPVIRVDLNTPDRKPQEVNERGYLPWAVRAGKSDSILIKGVRFTFTSTGMKAGYYKAGVQAPYYARLVSDGISVNGGQLELRISGLPAGPHTLLTYHNEIDGKTDKTDGNFADIDIDVDGVRQVAKLHPTYRVKENSDAKTAYLHFTAKAGKDVVITFTAVSGPAANQTVIINGFELNTPNTSLLAHKPLPTHGNEHADCPGNQLQLNWTAAPGAVAHEVYFGTDSEAVLAAAKGSTLYKGKITDTTYTATNLYSMLKYYWRVDEVAKDGSVTKGNVWYFRPRQLAFADAEGYGRFARGGRGGKVVEVTNLNDDGPGSLREAVDKNIGPRTIVFAVSGTIELKSRLTLTQKGITIAGQTAPGQGICIIRAPLGIVADDDVIRFLRVRIGAGKTYDGMGITGADNAIVDHCSISWTIDESFSSRGAHNITLQRTMIAEALNVAGHAHYEVGKAHGFAASIGGEVGSFHHNLLADCSGRNWSLAGGVTGDGDYLGKMDIRNNVVYNWDTRATDGGAKEVNFVGNYYKPGAATEFMYALNAQHEGYGGGSQRYYFAGNIMPGRFDLSNQEAGREETGRKVTYQTFVDKPFFEPYVHTQSAEDAYKDVLSDVGCNEPFFDEHDSRIITETLAGTYSFKGSKSGKPGLPDTQDDAGGFLNYPEVHRPTNFDSDHDGLPDWWEKLHGTNVNSAAGDFSDANADPDHDGFTALDDYLQWMSTPHLTIQPGQPATIDLTQLTCGYTDKPVYTVSNEVNGKAIVQKNGKVQFTPTAPGLASFRFMVKDAKGSTFSRTVNVLAGNE